METYITLMLTMASLQKPSDASYNLVMSPEHQHVFQSNQTVAFTCTADVRLGGCQFSWWDFDTGAGPVLELGRGSESPPDPAHLNSRISYYRYHGRGLWAGQCGISLQVIGYKTWVVACRVRPKSGGWKYAWADLYADDWAPMPNNLSTPREVVVLPGEEARLMMEAQEPLLQCRFHLPRVSDAIVFYQGAEFNNTTGRHRYIGAGLQTSECGVALTNVSETNNGLVKAYIRAPNWKEHIRFMALIVARRPAAPTMLITYTNSYLTATCEVKDGRPAVNITWFLGDHIIPQDEVKESHAGSHDEWRWPWMTGDIKQTVTRELKTEYQGKELRCVVTHVALDHPLEAGEMISFIDCGRRNTSQAEPARVNGDSAYVGEFPWHVAVGIVVDIFASLNTMAPVHSAFVCSGSLITTRIVLSAAFCVWDVEHGALENSSVIIAAGNLRRDNSLNHLNGLVLCRTLSDIEGNDQVQCTGNVWSDIQANDQVQFRTVQSITIPQRYTDRSFYSGNIALLELKVPVEVTPTVNPVCIDWGNVGLIEKSQLQPGNIGTIASWGSTQGDKFRDQLVKVDLPYVDIRTCITALEPGPALLLQEGDKFCAGYGKQSTQILCTGDDGAGLTFLHKETDRYYLQGVLSFELISRSPTEGCRYMYASFTSVSHYLLLG